VSHFVQIRVSLAHATYWLALLIYLLSSNIKQHSAECDRLQYDSVRGENKPADLQYLWWKTQTNQLKRAGGVQPESKNTIRFSSQLLLAIVQVVFTQQQKRSPRGYIVLLLLDQFIDCMYCWLFPLNKLHDHGYWFSNSNSIFLTSDSTRHIQIYKNGKSHQHALLVVPWLILRVISFGHHVQHLRTFHFSRRLILYFWYLFFHSIKISFCRSLRVFYSIHILFPLIVHLESTAWLQDHNVS